MIKSTINNVNDKICFICFSMTFLNDIYDDAYSNILGSQLTLDIIVAIEPIMY